MEPEKRIELIKDLEKITAKTNTKPAVIPKEWKIPDLSNKKQQIVFDDLDACNKDLFQKLPDAPQLGKVNLDKPVGENFAALEEENTAMNLVRKQALKKKKKVEPDATVLFLQQRKKSRRLHRLIFRKVYWVIILTRVQARGVRWYQRITQWWTNYQQLRAQKRIARQNRPKIKMQLISFNKRHNLTSEDIAKKFAQKVKG